MANKLVKESKRVFTQKNLQQIQKDNAFLKISIR